MKPPFFNDSSLAPLTLLKTTKPVDLRKVRKPAGFLRISPLKRKKERALCIKHSFYHGGESGI